MSRSINPTGDVSDEEKAHTPDKLRNDEARWKDHDMPDEPDGRDHAEPEQYDRGPRPGPDRMEHSRADQNVDVSWQEVPRVHGQGPWD